MVLSDEQNQCKWLNIEQFYYQHSNNMTPWASSPAENVSRNGVTFCYHHSVVIQHLVSDWLLTFWSNMLFFYTYIGSIMSGSKDRCEEIRSDTNSFIWCFFIPSTYVLLSVGNSCVMFILTGFPNSPEVNIFLYYKV